MHKESVYDPAPESLCIAIRNLWRASISSEEEYVRDSREFHELEDTCRSIYLECENSRFKKPPSAKSTPSNINTVLKNFFCWNGAPWLSGPNPRARETAATLHREFLRQSVRRTYLVPLNGLYLEDPSSVDDSEITSICFGPNEVVLLDLEGIDRCVPVDALARFGPMYQFPREQLAGSYWLKTSESEPAGSMESRTWHRILLDFMAPLRLFRSTYPEPVENALFVLLLALQKGPQDSFWEPFLIPWTYSFTDDLFSDPAVSPDPSELAYDIVGHGEYETEVPSRSLWYEFEPSQQDSLLHQWKDLQTVLARVGNDNESFNPLTRHFFVKALSENGVDQLISNLSCIEATLQLKKDRRRVKLKNRFTRLVDNDDASEWLNSSYRLRDDYLHSLADPDKELQKAILARARWAVATAVDRYLKFAIQNPQLGRSQLLEKLE